MAVLKRGFPGEKSHRTDNTAFGIGAAGMGNKKTKGKGYLQAIGAPSSPGYGETAFPLRPVLHTGGI